MKFGNFKTSLLDFLWFLGFQKKKCSRGVVQTLPLPSSIHGEITQQVKPGTSAAAALDKIDIAAWSHTAMVGGTVCNIESLDPIEVGMKGWEWGECFFFVKVGSFFFWEVGGIFCWEISLEGGNFGGKMLGKLCEHFESLELYMFSTAHQNP